MKLTTTDPVSHVKITTAWLIALVHEVAGLATGLGVLHGNTAGLVVTAAVSAVNAGGLIANAVHALAGSNVSVDDLKAGVDGFVHAALGKIDFNALVKDAVDAKGIPTVPDIEATVQAEVRKLLGSALAEAPAAVTLGSTVTGTAPGSTAP